MAEIAWSMYLLDATQAELESKGYGEFVVNRKDVVRVGLGFMEFHFMGKTERVPVNEMKDIAINAGWFSFKTSEARCSAARESSASSTDKWGTPGCSCCVSTSWQEFNSRSH